MSEGFRIAWTRTGGFAGVARTLTVDADDLDAGEREAVAALLDEVTDGPPAPRGADRFTHELTIIRGGATRRYTVHDGALPPAVAELLRRLSARGKRAGGDS